MWVSPKLIGDIKNTRNMLAIAVHQARNMEAQMVIACVPEHQAHELASEHIVRGELEAGDSWYLKMLA